MSEITFKDKFIGFVDILGFKQLVKAAEDGTGMPLEKLLDVVKDLGTPGDRKKFEEYGPMTCPESKYIQRDLDFRVTLITDCMIVTSEISPAGVINLIHHCWAAVLRLLTSGIMCRGYITKGAVYHTEAQILGSGYQEAYAKESEVAVFKREASERGTPYVEVDQVVCDYIDSQDDSCIKTMFSRYVKEDGHVTALFPFQRLQHSFMLWDWQGNQFDPKEERKSNENTRKMFENMKRAVLQYVDKSIPDVVSKAEHYISALDAQLCVCDHTAAVINSFPNLPPKKQ